MIKIMWSSTYRAELQEAKHEAFTRVIDSVRDILKNTNGKVFLEGVTLRGDNQTVEDCLFLGCVGGITVESDTTGTKIVHNVFEL